MGLSLKGRLSRLPKRFPVGATYVVEGRTGKDGYLRVFSRYVILPGGRRITVPADCGARPRTRTASRRGGHHHTGRANGRAVRVLGRKNIFAEAGTPRQHAR